MKQPINEIKRMQQLAGILNENEQNIDKDLIEDSINKIKIWFDTLDFESISQDERGNKIIDIIDNIDWAILIKHNENLFKLDKNDFTKCIVIKRDNGKIEIFASSEHRYANTGTISNSRMYEKGKFTNGIISFSYKGQLIGNNFNINDSNNELNPIDLEDIEYSIWGEGPTFTNSQMGGHGFYDWDLYQFIKNPNGNSEHKITIKNNKIIMVTEFNPYNYVDKKLFDQYWEKYNKNNQIIKNEDEDWSSTLINRNNKWYLIDKGDLKTILDINDSTSEEDKQKLLNNNIK